MKQWWKSKTLWVNLIIAILTTFEASTGLLQPYLPADIYVIVAISLPIINALLRIITTEKLIV